MSKPLDLYLIATRRKGYVLFSPAEAVRRQEAEEGDRVRHFIAWFTRRSNRILAWLGKVLRTAHDYYVKLEDRIDPVERILKAMASADSFVVHFKRRQSGGHIARDFDRVLKRQRAKHVFWLSVDFVLSAVVVALTPVLAPLPGPNVFFYYPFLRLLSHYRALRGAMSGLRSNSVEFVSLPEARRLEESLPSLARFLKRVE